VAIRFPSHIQTPAERHDFLLRLQERLRRFNNVRVREIARERGIEAAVRWHRGWFRPRNTSICQALLSLRPVLYPTPQLDEMGEDVDVPWRARKLRVRALPDDDPEMAEAEPTLVELESTEAELIDPTEDYTTYNKLDPNSRFSITASQITITGLTTNEDARVWADKGADHFGATFEHWHDVRRDSSSGTKNWIPLWAVSNVEDDARYWFLNYSQAAALTQYFGQLRLYEYENRGSDLSVNLDTSTWYYLVIERTGETALQCEIYSDASRTTLVDTLSVSLPSGRRYRYVFAVNSYNDGGSDTFTGYVANLDLKEGAPPSGVAPQFMHLARLRR